MLILPDSISIEGRVIVIIRRGDDVIKVIQGRNIVTNSGDQYYAEVAAGETPTKAFTSGGLRLGTGSTAPAKADTDVTTFATGAKKALASGYPKCPDTDTSNQGLGTDIVSWKFDFSAGDFTASGIAEGAIVDNITTPTAALCHFLFAASFDVTSSDNITIYVNHTMNGA